MILLPCPWCGPRNVGEFRYVGETSRRPAPDTATPDEWRRYLYTRRNPRGRLTERWYHTVGCRRYVTVDRDTLSNATVGDPRTGQDAHGDPQQSGRHA